MEWKYQIKRARWLAKQTEWFMVTEERAMPSYHAAAMPSPGWDSTIEPVGRDFLHFSFF